MSETSKWCEQRERRILGVGDNGRVVGSITTDVERIEAFKLLFHRKIIGLHEPAKTDVIRGIIAEALEDMVLFGSSRENLSIQMRACWEFCCEVGFETVYDGMAAAKRVELRTEVARSREH